MSVKKLFGVSLCAVALVGTASGVASAGEVTGNGNKIEVHGRSLCAYSGLDDLDEGEDPNDPTTDDFGRTQNFGQIVAMYGPMPGGAAFGCNPNLAGGH